MTKEYAEEGLAKLAAQAAGEHRDEILSRIVPGTGAVCADCDCIVEAAVEDSALKSACLSKLSNEIVKNPDCLFATTTSTLSVTKLGKDLRHPLIGMHFFTPVPEREAVELVLGLCTDVQTLEKAKAVLEKLGKRGVVVSESPGNLVNRVLFPMINEAVTVLAEGLSDTEDIDAALRLSYGLPEGPLELADEIGLDNCLAVLSAIHRETGREQFRPHPLLRKLVRGGRCGRKAGIGFYDYRNGDKRALSVR